MTPFFVVRRQPICNRITDYRLVDVSEHHKKMAFRQWATASQFMIEAIEKIVMVAQDEGQLSHEAVEVYWTSCTEFTFYGVVTSCHRGVLDVGTFIPSPPK